ncbi:MAG: hypothetical protein QW197_01495 [Candidatus Aenigmatarchaeota archaeon]
MILKIVGIFLIIFGIYFYLKNRESIFSSLRFNIHEIEKVFKLISLLLIIIGVILILW